MPDVIQCPSCHRPLRVPDELVGLPVKCPDCGMVFLTVTGTPASPTAPASVPPSQVTATAPTVSPVARGIPEPFFADDRASTAVGGPGVALLIVGILGLIASSFSLLAVLGMDHEKFMEGFKSQMEDVPPEQVEEMGRLIVGPAAGVIHGVFVAISLLVLLGAVMMLRRRFYPLAVLGSVLAMINLETCCCVLGLPVGFWSLLVLMRADVQETFR